ncbi:MAG: hypothetical protein HZB33_09540 [Nitrospirae bacterium]|nr:hypothetical protein [Nitrospirota bacterium]
MNIFTRLFFIAAIAGIMNSAVTAVLPLVYGQSSGSAYAEDWKTEFDEICRKTNDPVSLSKEELKALISRSDKLKTVIETLGETEKKVYLKRLRVCRELFVFMLESKEKE